MFQKKKKADSEFLLDGQSKLYPIVKDFLSDDDDVRKKLGQLYQKYELRVKTTLQRGEGSWVLDHGRSE